MTKMRTWVLAVAQGLAWKLPSSTKNLNALRRMKSVKFVAVGQVSSLAITAILKPLKRRSGVAGFIPAISEKWIPADCYTSQDVNPICIFRVALTYTLAKSKRYYSRILLWLKSPLLGCQTPSGARSAWPWW